MSINVPPRLNPPPAVQAQIWDVLVLGLQPIAPNAASPPPPPITDQEGMLQDGLPFLSPPSPVSTWFHFCLNCPRIVMCVNVDVSCHWRSKRRPGHGYNFPCSRGGTLPNRTESAVGELSIRPVQQLPRPSLHTATEEALVGLETNRVWLLLTCRSQICTSTARRPEAILLQRLVNTITK